MFLIKSDYLPLIREDKLDQITQADDTLLDRALKASQEEAAGYTRHRYDYGLTYKSVTEVASDAVTEVASDAVTGVLTGDRFYNTTTGLHYVATADGGADLTDTDFFEQRDSRNAKLVEVVVDIVLYNIHSRINPKSVPSTRRIRYDGDDPKQQGGALGWLKMVQRGTVTPDLPVITDADGVTPQNTETLAFGITSNNAHAY